MILLLQRVIFHQPSLFELLEHITKFKSVALGISLIVIKTL